MNQDPVSIPSPAAGTVLFASDFSSPDLGHWTSYVGGEYEVQPGWIASGGTLEQPTVDGLLRAILVGEPAWSDYSVETSVRIDSSEEGSRAGVVFRDDGRGFYVLRLCRGTPRAQLMYHSRSPFGWYELATVPLVGSKVNDDWVDLKITVRGPYIAVTIEGTQYLDIADSRSGAGRAGFYCCESRALFKDMRIEAKSPIPPPPSRRGAPPYAPTESFWFRETFTDQDHPSWTMDTGWSMGGAVCFRDPRALKRTVSLQNTPVKNGLIQLRLRLFDLTGEQMIQSMPPELRVILRPDEPLTQPPPPPDLVTPMVPVPNAGRAGLVFRGQDSRYYALLLDRANAKVVMVYRDDSTVSEEVLSMAELEKVPEDRWFTLIVQLAGDTMVGLLDGVPCMHVTDSRMSTGSVGLYADGGPTMFTDLLAASGQ